MKKTVILSALAFAGIQASAQVSDISVTLQPTASYNWFDDDSAIDDGLMIGGRVGFGFGEAIELRGVYEKSVDLENTASDIDWVNNDSFEGRDVDVERIGGEIKANIPTGGDFAPYLTLGSGVQKLKVDNFAGDGIEQKSEQVYASGGLGVKVNLGDRLTLNLEGKNTIFNLNPTNVLYTPDADNNDGLQEALGDDQSNRMYNWSILGGLQFYLGGREPGTMTDLDRAYYRKFSGGLSGLKISVEPAMAYINFDDDTNLNDTYLLGGQIGFDLNQYIGLRGYYYQASQDEEFSTDWDDLAIYGGDLIAKLNISRGLVPYLTVGGGYMNVYDSYRGENELLLNTSDESGYFAKGGLGLIVPVTKNLELYGAANLMYTSSRGEDDYQNITSPDELKEHTMYNAGIRIQFGKNANEDEILQDELGKRSAGYESRISELERELQEAYRNNDTDKAVEIIEEKKALENGEDSSRIRMTPEELESLIEKTIKEVDSEYAQDSQEQRIDRLETLLLETNNNSNIAPARQDANSQAILNELRRLNDKVDRNSNNINRLGRVNDDTDTVIVTNSDGTTTPVRTSTNVNTRPEIVTTVDENNRERNAMSKGLFLYEGMSIFAGAAFGDDDTAPVIGIRGHYSITNTGLEFMPDIYLSPSSTSGFGINANALYSFDQLSTGAIVKPYLGIGVGYNNIGDTDKFGTNLIIGTSFDVLGGNLYADYTARGFVDIHQVAVGYKFGF
ncbi:outer membrane beta-barrel protein [Flavobacteriaceae bacterium Ap0902]|nr:outer membrane beta-barrel protein [Flavobacteriaceae bacterium Ap0902]